MHSIRIVSSRVAVSHFIQIWLLHKRNDAKPNAMGPFKSFGGFVSFTSSASIHGARTCAFPWRVRSTRSQFWSKTPDVLGDMGTINGQRVARSRCQINYMRLRSWQADRTCGLWDDLSETLGYSFNPWDTLLQIRGLALSNGNVVLYYSFVTSLD